MLIPSASYMSAANFVDQTGDREFLSELTKKNTYCAKPSLRLQDLIDTHIQTSGLDRAQPRGKRVRNSCLAS